MIICCGEALIDMIPRVGDDGQSSYLPVTGGAVFNTAISLGRLEEDVGFFSGVSYDPFGEMIIEALQDSNVNKNFCLRNSYPTTLAFVELKDGNASYRFYDESSAMRMFEEKNISQIPPSVLALHFGGISLIPEPCGSVYESLLKTFASSSVISLDPNIRQHLIFNKAKHKSRLNRMISQSDIIKVSDEDLEWMTGEANPENLIQSWLNDHAKLVIITRGSDGLTAYTKGYKIEKEARKVEVVDTIGAGDTFNAGILSSLKRMNCLSKKSLTNLDEKTLNKCLSFAIEVAALTVSKAGANPPWRAELKDWDKRLN